MHYLLLVKTEVPMLDVLHLIEEDDDPGQHGQGDDELDDGKDLTEACTFGGAGKFAVKHADGPEAREHQGGIAACQQYCQGKEENRQEDGGPASPCKLRVKKPVEKWEREGYHPDGDEPGYGHQYCRFRKKLTHE